MKHKSFRHSVLGKLVAITLAAMTLVALGGRPAYAATITVVNGEVAIAANGKCSLREAIANANDTLTGRPYNDCAAGNRTGPDTINLPSNGNFLLTDVHDPLLTPVQGATGLPNVSTTIIIRGNGSTIQRNDSGAAFRFFMVDPTGNLTLDALTITSGLATTAGSGTPYTDAGGAIRNELGKLVLTNSTVVGNEADSGGGLYSRGGTISVDGSRIQSNTARLGGGIGLGEGATLQLSNSDISFNVANSGGGLLNQASTVDVTWSTFRKNLVNGSETPGGAAAILGGSRPAYFDFDGVKFVENEAGVGGALYAGADGIVRGLGGTFQNNKARADGGGIYITSGSNLTLNRSGLHGNSAGRNGGAIFNSAYTPGSFDVQLFNTTLSYNSAPNGRGGGIYNNPGYVVLANVTLTRNNALYAGGGFYHGAETSSVIDRSIVSGNTARNGDEIYSEYPRMIGSDYNLYGHDGATTAEALWNVVQNPTTDYIASNDSLFKHPLSGILDPNLKLNGGQTSNHALPFGSPAIDSAPSAECLLFPTNGYDQRGLKRNANGNQGSIGTAECDRGAVERQPGERTVNWWWMSAPKPGGINLYGTQMDFRSGDILEFSESEATWTILFGDSLVGISKNVTGLGRLADGSVLVSFGANQAIPGVGTFTPWDIARLSPAGAWSWYLDGSTVGLTTAAEKIDALTVSPDGRLLVSPFGAATVSNAAGQTIRPQDEDLMAFVPAAGGGGSWSIYFDGSTIQGLAIEDVVNASVDPATGDLFLGLADSYNVGGIKGNNRELIVIGRGPENTVTVVKSIWNGTNAGWDIVPDALEVR